MSEKNPFRSPLLNFTHPNMDLHSSRPTDKWAPPVIRSAPHPPLPVAVPTPRRQRPPPHCRQLVVPSPPPSRQEEEAGVGGATRAAASSSSRHRHTRAGGGGSGGGGLDAGGRPLVVPAPLAVRADPRTLPDHRRRRCRGHHRRAAAR